MLTKIGIGNFKAFASMQYVPIKPITLIYGANSAGKSSILQSLVFTHQAMQDGNLDIHHTALGGESVDLGGFGQFIHRRNTDLRLSWMAELDTKSIAGKLAELLARVKKVSLSLEIGLPKKEEQRDVLYRDEASGEILRTQRAEMVITGAPEVMNYLISGDGEELFRFNRENSSRLASG